MEPRKITAENEGGGLKTDFIQLRKKRLFKKLCLTFISVCYIV